jgi:hypothetical protein
MKITASLFEAFLKCPTKCYLRSVGETGSGNAYADWVKTRNESYHADGTRRLSAGIPPSEKLMAPPPAANLKAAGWTLAVDVTATAKNLETTIHALDRVTSDGQGQTAQFIPIRFSTPTRSRRTISYCSRSTHWCCLKSWSARLASARSFTATIMQR